MGCRGTPDRIQSLDSGETAKYNIFNFKAIIIGLFVIADNNLGDQTFNPRRVGIRLDRVSFLN